MYIVTTIISSSQNITVTPSAAEVSRSPSNSERGPFADIEWDKIREMTDFFKIQKLLHFLKGEEIVSFQGRSSRIYKEVLTHVCDTKPAIPVSIWQKWLEISKDQHC